jgi:hypothetical protein
MAQASRPSAVRKGDVPFGTKATTFCIVPNRQQPLCHSAGIKKEVPFRLNAIVKPDTLPRASEVVVEMHARAKQAEVRGPMHSWIDGS